MKKPCLSLFGLLVLIPCTGVAMQAIGTPADSDRSSSPPRAVSLPSPGLVHLRGTIDTADTAAGVVRLNNGAAFQVAANTKVFAGGRQGTRFQLRPGTQISADVDLNTGEAKNVWIER